MPAVMRTNVGLVRSQNEDAVWMDDILGIYAVADGMGGHLAGEVASAMAIEAVQKMARENAGPSIWALRKMAQDANEAILGRALAQPECAGMGTTLSMLWRAKRYAYIVHVGDSRIYRLRDEYLEQITRDHSLVGELVEAGLITAEQARTHPRRNIITRALGTQGDNAPDVLAADVMPGDLWLLCSDGLSGMVGDAEIEATLRAMPLEAAADKLIQQALDAGGTDNVSLILCRMEEEKPWNRG